MTLPIHSRPGRYHAYMLRLWEERGDAPNLPGTWRCSLEDAHTGEKHGFGSLEALLAFLRKRVTDVNESSGLERG